MIAYLFPGQGEECPQMASHYLLRPGPVKDLIEVASDALSLDLTQIIMKGSPQLTRTEILQPALTAISIGLALELQNFIAPQAVAGHSLGEVAAVTIAGFIQPKEAVRYAIERGKHMAAAAKRHSGAMLATTTELKEMEGVELAAENSPTQWVYTGEKQAIEALLAKIPSTRVPVSGAWHSRLMSGLPLSIPEQMGSSPSAPFPVPRSPFPALPRLFCNYDGSIVEDSTKIAELLLGQLTKPIRWVSVMKNMWQRGCRTFYLLGPSRALKGLCRGNLPIEAKIISISGKRDIAIELNQKEA